MFPSDTSLRAHYDGPPAVAGRSIVDNVPPEWQNPTECQCRSAPARRNSFNPGTMEFEAVAATETPVERRDACGPYLEVLPVGERRLDTRRGRAAARYPSTELLEGKAVSPGAGPFDLKGLTSSSSSTRRPLRPTCGGQSQRTAPASRDAGGRRGSRHLSGPSARACPSREHEFRHAIDGDQWARPDPVERGRALQRLHASTPAPSGARRPRRHSRH